MSTAEASYLLRNQPEGVRSQRELLTLLSIAYAGDASGVCSDLNAARTAARQGPRAFSAALGELVAAGLVRPRDDGSHEIPALRRQSGRPGYVYLMRCGKRYKIGRSRDPHQRRRSLQTASPEPVEIIAVYEAEDAAATERAAHERYAHCRVGGEWFALSPDEAAELVAAWQRGCHDG